jgi:inositol oxygenase
MDATKPASAIQSGPLKNLEEWDDFVKTRYAEDATTLPASVRDTGKKPDEFRNYSDTTPPRVREFYRQNHTYQTRDFVLDKKKQFLPRNRARMGIWEAM